MDKRKALTLLVREIGDQIDTINSLRSAGFAAKISSQILAETTSVLKELPQDMQDLYFDILINDFTQRSASDQDRFNNIVTQDAGKILHDKIEAKIISDHAARVPTILEKVRLAR